MHVGIHQMRFWSLTIFFTKKVSSAFNFNAECIEHYFLFKAPPFRILVGRVSTSVIVWGGGLVRYNVWVIYYKTNIGWISFVNHRKTITRLVKWNTIHDSAILHSMHPIIFVLFFPRSRKIRCSLLDCNLFFRLSVSVFCSHPRPSAPLVYIIHSWSTKTVDLALADPMPMKITSCKPDVTFLVKVTAWLSCEILIVFNTKCLHFLSQ